MIAYFDTSAFVPLLVNELSSDLCEQLWASSDGVVSSRLIYVEAGAALSRACRLDRLTQDDHKYALRTLEELASELSIVEVTEDLVVRAGRIAHDYELRGYDAVHCASAEWIDDSDLVVFSGDVKLLKACRALGMAVADINAPG